MSDNERMPNDEAVNTDKGDTGSNGDNAPIVAMSNGRSPLTIWLTTPIIIIVIVMLVVTGYLFSSGIDISYAVGTSNWIAPPGSKLAGHDIGGKTFNEVEDLLETMNSDFSGLSVWVVESSLMLSVYDGDFNFSSTPEHFALSVAPSEFGVSLDIDTMQKELDSLDQKSNDILLFKDRLELWNEPPVIDVRLTIDNGIALEFLDGVRSTVECEPVSATMDLPNHRITPSSPGVTIDPETILAGIPTIYPSIQNIPVEIKLELAEPEISEEDFAHIDAEIPLATYTTNFNRWKRNRSFNIELGASHFEGMVIRPGEIFSFNETTGQRGYSQGYLAAPMYLNRRPEMEPAGGMCQVSTTLYNTLLLAGFEIVERLPHSRPCSYVPYGRDATVAYGAVDLKMKNTLNHPVVLHQIVNRETAGTITFEIFGHPDDRVNVEIGNAYSWIARTESMTQYEIDLSLDACEEVVEDNGVNGLRQRTWRIWYDGAGTEILYEELTNDNVRPVGAFIRHNPCDGPVWMSDKVTSDTDPGKPAETPEDDPGIYF